jgi:hypothetical protein
MAEFETGGFTYRCGKMSAREQLHLLRGLGPLLGPMVQMALTQSVGEATPVERQLAFMVPFFEAFAHMSEEEVNTLVNKCFAVTHRREGTNGSNIWGPPLRTPGASQDQYSDIDLNALMTICWTVIQENLGGFFAIAPNAPTPVFAPPPTPPSPG